MTLSKMRVLRALAAFALGSALSFAMLEVALRVALFSERPAIAEAAARLRNPMLYGSPFDHSLYWKLRYLWTPEARRRPMARYADELVGWRPRFVRADFTHEDADALEGRRPVLLYGDSYAQCVTGADGCFQELFRRSDLDGEYLLLNYGVGGQGLDQILLMLRASIDHYVGLDPIVILSLLVDDDLNRMVLDFRELPKPVLALEDGELVPRPPFTLDCDEYLAARPPEATSWLWRLAVHGTDLLPGRFRGAHRGFLRKQELARAVFASAKAELDARGIEWFVLFFHNEGSARARKPRRWEEEFLQGCLAELDVPYVSSRPDLRRAARELDVPLKALYIPMGERGGGHLNALGNEAVLMTMRRGLAGDFDPYEFQRGERRAPRDASISSEADSRL